MELNSIELTNFRNHSKRLFELAQKTAIVGSNGRGKTNILEAIRYLSIMKSFRAKREREAIQLNESVARIVGRGLVNDLAVEVAISLTPDKKQVTVNGVKKRVSAAIGVFKTVLFAPDDLDFVTGQPTLRRRFLDMILAQKDPLYVTALLDTYRIVKQRNITLQRIAQGRASATELAVWDDQLMAEASRIQPLRKKLIAELNRNLSQRYREISGEKSSDLAIIYQQSPLNPAALAQVLARDIRYRATTIGPHHDDIILLLNSNSLASFGSRGERRSAVLAIKQTEVDVLTIDGPPILLLDDIFSELDHSRQERLISLFENQQTIITATKLPSSIKKICTTIIEL